MGSLYPFGHRSHEPSLLDDHAPPVWAATGLPNLAGLSLDSVYTANGGDAAV
jgi:hypothetical protein